MNKYTIIFSILIVILLFILIKYNVTTSSPELLEASIYKDNNILSLLVDKEINDIVVKAKDSNILTSLVDQEINDILVKAKDEYSIELFVDKNTPVISFNLYYDNTPKSMEILSLFTKTISTLKPNNTYIFKNITIFCGDNNNNSICNLYKTFPTLVTYFNGIETNLYDTTTTANISDLSNILTSIIDKYNMSTHIIYYYTTIQYYYNNKLLDYHNYLNNIFNNGLKLLLAAFSVNIQKPINCDDMTELCQNKQGLTLDINTVLDYNNGYKNTSLDVITTDTTDIDKFKTDFNNKLNTNLKQIRIKYQNDNLSLINISRIELIYDSKNSNILTSDIYSSISNQLLSQTNGKVIINIIDCSKDNTCTNIPYIKIYLNSQDRNTNIRQEILALEFDLTDKVFIFINNLFKVFNQPYVITNPKQSVYQPNM